MISFSRTKCTIRQTQMENDNQKYFLQWISTSCLTSCLGPKKQDFWSKINDNQMQLPNFVNPSADSLSKIRHDFSNKEVKNGTHCLGMSYYVNYQLLLFGSSPNSYAASGYIWGHNFWTNKNLGPLSISKWPFKPQLCERWR